MCSWCWAFRPVWQALKLGLPDGIQVHNSLGGLAPDSNEPMSVALQKTLQAIWHKIQHSVPNTSFNFDFWHLNTPRRSTYPACRAIIAARDLGAEMEEKMIFAIQNAYYQLAKNPSDDSTLLTLADQIGLDISKFEARLNHPQTQQQLDREIAFNQRIHATSFPSLVLEVSDVFHSIPIDYCHAETMLKRIREVLKTCVHQSESKVNSS